MTWIRSQRAVAVDVGTDLVLLGRDGLVRTLTGDSAELARAVLAQLAAARSDGEIAAHVESLASEPDRGAVLPQLIELLRATGAIEEARPPVRTPGVNVVVGVTGAIAATHAPALIGALQQRGHTIEVALTATATRFVALDALAALVRRAPHTSLWPHAAHAPVPHVALAEWAELVVIYPASATTLGRLANGDFSELVAALALATRAPLVIVPSMNVAMMESPAVQRNLERLRGDGHAIVHGVPSREVADAPAVRDEQAAAAPSPAEVITAIEALRAAGLLHRRGEPAADWNAAYRRATVPWASETCDADLAAALARVERGRLLDVGCGLGQVARHAAAAGHRVVAIDTSEVALALARTRAGDSDIVWLRDDVCASALAGPFDVIVDRATLHALPRSRVAAWAAQVRRLAAPRAHVIVKCHAEGVPGITSGWTAAALAELLPDFALVSDEPAELPGPADPAPIASRLVVLRR